MTKTRAPKDFLTTGQVAALLHVSAKTVSRWAVEGKLRSGRTLGGHYRFNTAYIRDVAERLTHDADGIEEAS